MKWMLFLQNKQLCKWKKNNHSTDPISKSVLRIKTLLFQVFAFDFGLELIKFILRPSQIE